MAKAYTINTLLCLEKSLKSRLAILRELSAKCATRTVWMDSNKVEEPMYDVKKVDEMVVKLTRALFDIDMKIKEANAKAKVEMGDDFDFDYLMSPIQ